MHKFHGAIAELQKMMKLAAIRGKWQSDSSKHTFRTQCGGILNWWPKTGTMQFQGKDPAKSALELSLSAIINTPYQEPEPVLEPHHVVAPYYTDSPSGLALMDSDEESFCPFCGANQKLSDDALIYQFSR